MQDSSLKRVIEQHFQVDQALRRGDGASTWLARGNDDGRACVLKIVPAARAGSPESLGARLQGINQPLHPGVVRPYGWACGARQTALWRPFIEGQESTVLSRAPLDQILAAAHRVAEALHSTHGAGLVHAALKPANVFLNQSGSACLLDFAPQPAGDRQADIRALGELIYFWLTGGACPRQRDGESLARHFRRHGRAELLLPPQLGGLLVAMLETPEARPPPSALTVRDHIDDVRLLLAGNPPQAIREEWSQASWVPPPAEAPIDAFQSAARRPTGGRRSVSKLTLGLALAALLAAIFTVVMIVPQRIEDERAAAMQAPGAESPDPALVPPAAAPPSAEELEEMLRQRQQAQAILDELIELQHELQEQQVERWGERRFAEALARAHQGDEPFRAQDFVSAATIYSEALSGLEEVAALRPLILEEALERGAAAISAVDSESAAEAFSLAMAIDPDNQMAQQGLERAASLDEVVALLAAGEAAEQVGRLQAARDAYEQALNLDPATEGVAASLARVQAALKEQAFRGAMSRALAALGRGDWPTARGGFREAEGIRPGSRAVADGLVELERRIRDQSIAAMGELAATAVSQERWEAAREHYAQMLAKDPNLRSAQEGLRLAEQRLDLHRRLESFVNQPSSWWSDPGRAEAASLLYDAKATPNPGPRLRDQVATLEQQLELAVRPVEVTLISDESCEVVVYKIARLGQFQSTRLQLLPGRYTAVGTRDGYRDVRRDFLVAAGSQPEPVSLRCQEQVFAGGP